MNDSICVNSLGNLQMNLPLRDDSPFPDNRTAVFKRTLNTLNRLRKDKLKLEQCVSVMESYLWWTCKANQTL